MSLAVVVPAGAGLAATPLPTTVAADARSAAPITVAKAQASTPWAVSRK